MVTVRFVGGATGNTGWLADHGGRRKIDTTTYHLQHPVHFCSLRGEEDLWLSRGASALYDVGGSYGAGTEQTKGQAGFEIFVDYDEVQWFHHDNSAAERHWSVEWISVDGLDARSCVIDTSVVDGKVKEEKTHERLLEGRYRIVSEVSGKVLSVEGDHAGDGTRVIQYDDKSQSNQWWELTKVAEEGGDVFYTIKTLLPEGRVMEARGPWTEIRENEIVMRDYEKNGDDRRHRQWKFDPVPEKPGFYWIVSRRKPFMVGEKARAQNPLFVIDVESPNTASNAVKMYQYWPSHVDGRQHWRMERLPDHG